MTYRNIIAWGLGLAIVAAGCTTESDDDDVTRAVGESGESCQARADCAAGLLCINNVCVVSGQNDDDGNPPASTSKLGESCASRADCELGLACINLTCVSSSDLGEDTDLITLGQRGESCRTRADCASELACVDNVCWPSDLDLTPTGKHCVQIECDEPADCCADTTICVDARRLCAAGDETYCDIAESAECQCPNWACVNNTCERTAPDVCETSVDCYESPGTPYCDGTRCVECLSATNCLSLAHCYSGSCECIENRCEQVCIDDRDCPGLQQCREGRCVEAPCVTQRECIASTGNVLSVCEEGVCREPCRTDAECFAGGQLKVCDNGTCVAAGCETKQECRILMPNAGIDVDCVPDTTETAP